MIYLATFLFSTFFTFLAEKTTKNKSLFFLFSLIAILLPSLLAGFRDSSIGTDTSTYVDSVWLQITNIDTWNDFLIAYKDGLFLDIEIIYLLINWGCNLFGESANLIYFASNFIVVLLFYCSAYDNRNKMSMWICMALFFLLYYNISLNMVRQSIALSMCVYSYKYFERKEWKKLAIWYWCIILTHNTGVFYLLFLVFQYIINLKFGIKRKILLFSFMTFTIAFVFALDLFILLAVYLGIIPPKFLAYLSSEQESSLPKASFFLNIFILLIFIFIKYKCRIKRNTRNTRILSSFVNNKSIGTFMFACSLVSKWAFRISYYFNYISDCIFLPRALYILKKRNKKAYQLTIIIVLLFAISMWVWIIVYRNENDTYPYKSSILGIQ